jgi:hypothetical protein
MPWYQALAPTPGGRGLILLDGFVPGGEFGLHYAGDRADAQGSEYQADRAAFKAVLLRVSMLVASRASEKRRVYTA